jgi:flagellar motor switch protein FliN/FliY
MSEEATTEQIEETKTDDVAEEATSNDDASAESAAATEQASTSDDPGQPEFAELNPKSNPHSVASELSRLNDVKVTIAAELGRTTVPIQNLLQLSEGSVFELNRSIENPVELLAQGVPLGNGEVVVVDGNFAIRIQEIYNNQVES